MLFRTVSIVLLALLALPAGARESAEAAQSVAAADVARWNEAIARGAVDDIVHLYADNALLIAPSGLPYRSNEDIRKFWQTLIKGQAGNFSFRIVGAHGDKQNTIITRVVLSDMKSIPASTKSMEYDYNGVLYNVLKRQPDGHWKVSVQRWYEARHS